MQKLPKYLIVFLTLLVILFSGYFLTLYIFDGSTTVILQTYEFTKDEDVVRKHLLEYKGEFDNHNSRINFVSWGIKNPDDFVKISEGIDSSQKHQFCGLLAFAATDSGIDKDFEAAFEQYDTECLRIIRTEIAKNREWLQRLKAH